MNSTHTHELGQASDSAGSGALVSTQRMTVVVSRKIELAEGLTLFEAKFSDGHALPDFAPGAHISVTGPTGLSRKYSLCNAPGRRQSYLFAVKRDQNGSGGSIALVDNVEVGDALSISAPQNDFPLEPSASRFIFIAGGIGITPIYSMIQHLDAAGTPYTLYYLTRTESAAAFREALLTPKAERRVVFHHDGGDPSRGLNVAAVLAQYTVGTHVYVCGPHPLMLAVRSATSHWPRDAVHFEDFGSNKEGRSVGDHAFRVHLARSGRTVEVPVGRSIVEVLRDEAIDIPTSCKSGTCGTCKTPLLKGTADHRDLVLYDDELGSYIIPCVSRAKTVEISIDI